MITSKFKQYQDLKQIYDVVYEGVSFNKVLTPELIMLAYRPNELTQAGYKEIFKFFFKRMDLGPLKDAFTDADVVATCSTDRNDYYELITSCLKHVGKFNYVSLKKLGQWHSLTVNAGDVKFALSQVFSKGGTNGRSFKEKLFIAAHLAFYFRIYRDLKSEFANFDAKGKKHVSFNSSYDLEALLALFFNKIGIQTYHLSHGLNYIAYQYELPFDNVNGENISAGTVLTWGQSSKDDLITNFSFPADRIAVAGNPKYPAKDISVKTTFNNIIVFLGRGIYEKDNIDILHTVGKIAREQGIAVAVKIHPLTDVAVYKKVGDLYGMKFFAKEDTISQLLTSGTYDLAICYNTTVYYEAMYHDLLAFRYGVNENEAFKGLDDKFYDETSFKALIDTYKNADLPALNKQIAELLSDTLGMGIDNYNSVINK